MTEGTYVAAEHVVEIQRARLLTATVEVVIEDGPAAATVGRIVSRAGVSRRTFYEIFGGCEECLLAALDECLARASSCVSDAYDPDAKWAVRVRSALLALLDFLDRESAVGRLLIVESLASGPRARERRRRVIERIATVVDGGRDVGRVDATLPPLTAEGIVGGALSIVQGRMMDGGRPLVELVNPLMSMIVLPYLGVAASRAELQRPIQIPRHHDGHVSGDPLRDLGMRLTYRTVRVLLAIGARPGSSNREVGNAAGIDDQGQISKLLARLQGLGLIENTGSDRAKGAPNAWALTAKGTEVEQAMGAQPRTHAPAGELREHSAPLAARASRSL